MADVQKTQPSRAPKAPAGVLQTPVRFDAADATPRGPAALEAARREWFIQGTQQASFAINTRATEARQSVVRGQSGTATSGKPHGRITAPTTGTIIALDPDIPPKHQRVSFSAEGANLRWLMDGKFFAKGSSAQWLPWPGRHVVQIADTKGRVMDEVRLEVRGAGVKAPQPALVSVKR